MSAVARRARGFAIAALMLGCLPAPGPPLRVCLEAANPPFSSVEEPERGLDRDVAAFVAESMGRSLEIHWFEASEEEMRSMPLQVNWLLSAGRCDLVAGYPLARDGLGEASIEEIPPPARGADAASAPARAGTLVASLPYISLPLTLVSAPGRPPIARLDDVAGLRLAVERETLASAIAMVYGGSRLRERLLRVSFEEDAIFEALEQGAADVALVERHRYEIYRARVGRTGLRASAYQHVLAMNVGFVGIDVDLLGRVDRVLGTPSASRRVASIAAASGLSYSPPVAPAILPPITPRLLARRGD